MSFLGIPAQVSGAFIWDGAKFISISSSSSFRAHLVDYALTNATSSNPEIVGQVFFDTSQFVNSITLRAVLSNTGTETTSSIKLLNITSGAYVEIGGIGIEQLDSVGSTPTVVTSSNLRNAINFSTGSAIYELQLITEDIEETAYVGSAEILTAVNSVGADALNTNTHLFAFNETQTGTIEKNIGSIFLETNNIIKSDSRALLGGTTSGSSGILRIRRFTGADLLTSFTGSGTLSNNTLADNVDIVVSNTDWYDLTLAATGSTDTAIIRGLNLIIRT